MLDRHMTTFFLWLAGVIVTTSTVVAACISIVRNGIIISNFVNFLSELRPAFAKMQTVLETISRNAEAAHGVAFRAEAKAVEAVAVAREVAERVTKHLGNQDDTMRGQDDKLDAILRHLDIPISPKA